MRFALIIPALNEEQAIAGTLRRALAARASVTRQTPVTHMTVVFVNDGCTDRTQQIVDQPEFAEVVKVNYGRNRGYGAAIKAGFQATDADLVGFIDADGTCDPEFCVPLVNALVQHEADVVLARRLEPNTQMPLIRKVGNRLFATLLGVMSGQTGITDTASGYRVIKRASLKLMSPLPDGLHYTPAMSCICLLDPRLKIVEVPGMHYKEREGRSKLHVVRDGFRFLWTILFSACCYSPIKTMLMASGLVAAGWAAASGLALAAGATAGHVVSLAGVALGMVMVLLAAGAVAHELNYLLIGPRRKAWYEAPLQSVLDFGRLIVGGMVVAAAGLLATVGGWFVHATGLGWHLLHTLVSLLPLAGALMLVVGVLVRVIWAVGQKQKALLGDEYRVEAHVAAPTTLAGGPRERAMPPLESSERPVAAPGLTAP